MKKLTINQLQERNAGSKSDDFWYGACIGFGIGLLFVTSGGSEIAAWALRGTNAGGILSCGILQY